MDQLGQHPKSGVAVKQVFFTQKPDALYAITSGWPGKQFVLRNIKVLGNPSVTMLGVPGALKTSLNKDTLTITTPDLGPDQAPARHAFVFIISGAEVLPE